MAKPEEIIAEEIARNGYTEYLIEPGRIRRALQLGITAPEIISAVVSGGGDVGKATEAFNVLVARADSAKQSEQTNARLARETKQKEQEGRALDTERTRLGLAPLLPPPPAPSMTGPVGPMGAVGPEAARLGGETAEGGGGGNEEFEDLVAELVLTGMSEADARNQARSILYGVDIPKAGGGGGGGSTRFLFPEEQEALQLENEKNRRILAGELGFIEVRPGFFMEPLTGKTYDQNELDLAAKRIAEEARQFGLTFEEGVRRSRVQEGQFDRTESRLGRQLDLEGELGRGRLALDTELGRRRAGLDETNTIRDILSNPADFLARAFLSRGQASPDAPITQADLLNNLRLAVQGGAGAASPRLAASAPVNTAVEQQIAGISGQAPRLGAVEDFNIQTPTADLSGIVGQTAPGAGRILEAAAQAGWTPPTGFTGPQEGLVDSAMKHLGLFTELDPATQSWVFRQRAPMQQQTPRLAQQAPVTQEELVGIAREASPPAVNAVLGQGTEQLNPISMPNNISVSSPRQTSRLTGDETKALGTRLAAEGSSLGDFAAAQDTLFGNKRSTRRARLVV